MDTHRKVERVNEAAAIRIALPRHPVKRLARLLGVPIGTAHDWIYRRLSVGRQQEIARAILAEMDREDAEERAAARRRLEVMAGVTGVVDTPLGRDRGIAAGEEDRHAQDG